MFIIFNTLTHIFQEFYLSVTTSLSVTGNKTSTKRLTENQENPRNNSGENNKTQTNQQFVISKFWSVKVFIITNFILTFVEN